MVFAKVNYFVCFTMIIYKNSIKYLLLWNYKPFKKIIMKKALFSLLTILIILFSGCKNEEKEEVVIVQLEGTVWQKEDTNYKQVLDFGENNTVTYTLYNKVNGVSKYSSDTKMTYNIASGKPLVDNESILIISSSFYLYDATEIKIYKDFLTWETTSPYDMSETYKDTYKKIK